MKIKGKVAEWILTDLPILLLSVALVIAMVIIMLCILWYTGHWPGWLPYLEPTNARVTTQAIYPTLTNGDMEAGFYLYNGIGELEVAQSWEPWYLENKNSPGGAQYHRPEYKPEKLTTGKGRVRTGAAAQKQFTTYSAHDGGIWQRVQATPGQWYRFTAWVYVWSSGEDNADVSKSPGRYRAMVGINPWGDWAGADTTVWGQEIVDVYDRWVQVSVTAQAWGPTISLLTRGNPWHGAKHNDSYWDNLGLAQVEVGQVCPTPMPCPPCPTPGPGTGCNYDTIRGIMREELDRTRMTGDR